MIRQHTFPQRIGKLIEQHVIQNRGLRPNKRQQKRGFFDAYDDSTLYEIKAAKDDNYFRIMQKNHEKLIARDGTYIFVRYSLKNVDKDLKLISDIVIHDERFIRADILQEGATKWLEDQRKVNMFYKVKI